MIDRNSETLLLLKDVPRRIETLTGRRPSMATVHRWVASGLAGNRLETTFCGGSRVTSLEALERFDKAVTSARDGDQPIERQPATKVQKRQATRAARERLGI
ncbi:MAG: DUF1580 domain-containing protein [Aureliella sp.]